MRCRSVTYRSRRQRTRRRTPPGTISSVQSRLLKSTAPRRSRVRRQMFSYLSRLHLIICLCDAHSYYYARTEIGRFLCWKPTEKHVSFDSLTLATKRPTANARRIRRNVSAVIHADVSHLVSYSNFKDTTTRK